MIGLLAAISLPRIDYVRFRTDGGMQAVGTALLASQREAVARQHDVAVLFDVPGRSLRVLYDANNNRVADPGERVRVVALDDHVVFGRGAASARGFGTGAVGFTRQVAGLPAVVFHRNGSASEAGGVYTDVPPRRGRHVSRFGYEGDRNGPRDGPARVVPL